MVLSSGMTIFVLSEDQKSPVANLSNHLSLLITPYVFKSLVDNLVLMSEPEYLDYLGAYARRAEYGHDIYTHHAAKND